MRSLITGGAGFIGSNLADSLLKLGHEVVILDNLSTGKLSNLNLKNKKLKFINCDISDDIRLKNYFQNIDWVFHLAGLASAFVSKKKQSNYFKTNVIGTLQVLKACRNKKIKKFLYAASASCYGITKKLPTKENSKIDPQNAYALTKYLGEQLIIHWARAYDMPNVSLRLFNIYGPRLQTFGGYASVFGVFLKNKLSKKRLTIVGDGNQTRDFLHIFDLVEALVKAAKKANKGKIYNVGGGKEISINKLASLFGGNKVHVTKRLGETNRSLANINKIKKELNWRPKIKIEKGVKLLLETAN